TDSPSRVWVQHHLMPDPAEPAPQEADLLRHFFPLCEELRLSRRERSETRFSVLVARRLPILRPVSAAPPPPGISPGCDRIVRLLRKPVFVDRCSSAAPLPQSLQLS